MADEPVVQNAGSEPEIEGAPDISNLSPFKVLHKEESTGNQPATSALAAGIAASRPAPVVSAAPQPSVGTAPVTMPHPVAPVAVPVTAPAVPGSPAGLSKDELLRQAAEAPDVVFEVPAVFVDEPKVENPTEPTIHQEPTPGPSRFAQPTPPPASPAPVLPPIAPPASVQPVPDAPVPPARPMPVPPKPQAAPGAVPPAKPAMPLSTPPKKGNALVIAGLGILVLIILLAGGGAALAMNGIRIPVAYSWITGLSTKGEVVAQKALPIMAAKSSVPFTGSLEVTNKQSAANTSALPSLTGAPAASTPIHALSTAIKQAEEYKDGSMKIKGEISQNNIKSSIPIMVSLGSDPSAWDVYLDANTVDKLVRVKPEEVEKTLLLPVLRPMGIQETLKAIQSVNGYESSNRQATYHYRLNASKLPIVLPNQAAVKNAAAIVTYAWKTNQPVKSAVTLEFSYQGATYTYKETWVAQSSAAAANSWGQLASTDGAISKDIAIDSFVLDLGIKGLDVLPNTLNGALVGLNTNALAGSATASPSPTANPTASPTASPTPTAAATVIEPTGQGVTAVQESIVQAPAVPTQPASAEAKTRDAQRKHDLADLQSALEKYKTDTGAYPVSNGIQQTVASKTLLAALIPKYITKLPVDPLPHTYWYEYQSDGTTYTLRAVAEDSSDADALPGTQYHYFQYNNE